MIDRNSEYVLIQKRKARKPKQYYYDDDDDDDDDDNNNDDDDNGDNDNYSQIYGRLVPIKPRKEQRIKYISNDELDFDYRKQIRARKPQTRRKPIRDRIHINDDDNIIKVIRHNRTPSASPIEHRRLKLRPRENQPIFYETSSGHLVSRPPKKNILQTKKTQVVYADDEPTKIIKKVIIDPRTGDHETIYKKDQARKQRKYYLPQHPTGIYIDSDDEHNYYDDDDDDDERKYKQYVKIVKRRNISTEALPRRDPSPKYVMIKKKSNSEPVYALTSKMPAIKTNRRIAYEVPTKKSLTTYVVSSDGKYYK